MIPFRASDVVEAAVHAWLLRLIRLGRYQKRVILAGGDFIALGLALWLAMSARLGHLYVPPSWQLLALLCTAPAIGVATFFWLGLYRIVTRYMSVRGALIVPVAVSLSAMIWAAIVLLSGIQTSVTQPGGGHIVLVVPRSVVILYPILGSAFVWAIRQIAGLLLKSVGVELPVRTREPVRNVVIYGAGTTGIQLLEELRRSGTCEPIGFIDMSSTLWGMYINGLKVYRPERLPAIVERKSIHEVLLAMPKAKRKERQAALRQLEPLAVKVRTLPAIEDLAAGRVTVSDLRPVEAEDLLGRDPVPPNAHLLARSIEGKSVMVTGAGGSIGSELVRQILRQRPRRLVLLDAGEGPLYEVEREARELLDANAKSPAAVESAIRPAIVAVLGSVHNAPLVRRTIESNGVQTIYHAAAYKHVPIVEHNPIAGLHNNTFGTAALATAAESLGVERFVLVSTDKAVRPTSIMGASKRLAEMVLQARAAAGREKGTVFTMVRFGNVLDSSGSVVRMFRRQIEAGGPVTVTSREAIRYFMSIPEAAALVIQAGAMATGGDVFVLDMDEPVRIDDLAKSMIRLMGLEVRDEEHPDGDIAIKYIGLRDGEKLHEELLLGENITPTEHPRIFKSHEPFMPAGELARVMDTLRAAMDADDLRAIHATLARVVEGYRSEVRHLAANGIANGKVSTVPVGGPEPLGPGAGS